MQTGERHGTADIETRGESAAGEAASPTTEGSSVTPRPTQRAQRRARPAPRREPVTSHRKLYPVFW